MGTFFLLVTIVVEVAQRHLVANLWNGLDLFRNVEQASGLDPEARPHITEFDHATPVGQLDAVKVSIVVDVTIEGTFVQVSLATKRWSHQRTILKQLEQHLLDIQTSCNGMELGGRKHVG